MSGKNVNTESNYSLPFGPLRVRSERLPGTVIQAVFHTAGPPPDAPELIVRFPSQPGIRPRWWLTPNLCADDEGGIGLTRNPFEVESCDAVVRRQDGLVILEVAKLKGDAVSLRDRLTRHVEPVVQCLLAERGCTFLHASAVRMDDGAWVFPAWGQTGKTALVLELLREGAAYLGDDLVIVDAEGRVHPYPKAIALFGYNAAELRFVSPAFFLSRCRDVRRRDRVLARIDRRFIPRRRSAIFRIDELVSGATIAEACAAAQVHSMTRIEADWTSAATESADAIVNRHQAVLHYEFAASRLLLDAWRAVDPDAPALRAPAEPVAALAAGASCHAVFLSPRAVADEKRRAVCGSLHAELPPRPAGVQVAFEKGRDESVFWCDFHGLFKFVLRGGDRARELAARFEDFHTETPGADLQFAIRDSRLVSRTGAVLLEGRYAVTANHVVESECIDLAQWQPGLVRSIRMESGSGNTLVELRPALETVVRSRGFRRRTHRRELTADDLLYHEIEPALQFELLKHGATFLHASGVTVNGQAILFCGWKQMAKTALMLQFMRLGAGLLGDDFVVIDSGGQVYAYPGRMNVYDHHLALFPELAEAAARLPRDGAIARGAAKDFFPDRLMRQAPLHAVVLLGRARRASLQEADPAFAARFNRLLLDEEFAALRASTLARAFGRSAPVEARPTQGPGPGGDAGGGPLERGLARARAVILRLSEDKDLASVAEAILKHTGMA